MKIFRDENGQMLVFTALTMTALLGFLALATDVGVLFRAKRQLQIAADAAATAGAMDVFFAETSARTTTDAKSAAEANGATDGSNGTVVTVNFPPQSGYHQKQGYVEVLISQPNPTFFMRLFGLSSMTIGARAVAGSPGVSAYCGYLMDPTGIDLQMQGNSSISSSGCAWYLNSSSTSAISITGGSASVTAPFISVVGDDSQTITGTTVYPESVAQSPPNLQSTGWASGDTCDQTITGTSYSSTLDAVDGAVCFTGKNVNISGATLKNGVFVFENGVSAGVGSNTNVTNGTIEVYGGQFNQSTNSNLNITAPASRTETFDGLSYNGVALLVPAANTSYDDTAQCQNVQHGNVGSSTLQVQTGSSNQTFEGFIVAPEAEVFLNDHGGGVTFSGLWADCLFGKASVINVPSYNTANPTTTPLSTVALVE